MNGDPVATPKPKEGVENHTKRKIRCRLEDGEWVVENMDALYHVTAAAPEETSDMLAISQKMLGVRKGIQSESGDAEAAPIAVAAPNPGSETSSRR